ncbi:hypothetical protein EI94DRAFT_1805298 [Lactarius quietus]|nr:hypothetical protein EI94DRAFT_1805298 [Lactarius quietus]
MHYEDSTDLAGNEDIYDVYDGPLPPSFNLDGPDDNDTNFEHYAADALHVPRPRAQVRPMPPFDFPGEDDTSFDPYAMDTPHVPGPQARSRLPFSKDDSGFGSHDTLRVPKPQLRSRPAMDFSAKFPVAPSHLLGSTLRSQSSAFPRKAVSSIGLTSKLSPALIASLTDSDLHHNPLYCQLRQKYDYVSMVLAKYMDKELAAKQAAKFGPPLVPDIHQALQVSRSSSKSDSRTLSSLGLSDSVSQHSKFVSTYEMSVNCLLDHVEAPSQWPSYLPASVLWHYEDCQTDTSAGTIVTDANKHRPKMHLAIRRGDGSIISAPELALSSPHTSLPTQPQGSKIPTKSNIQKWFKTEYSQAIFELEAEQKLLHLCAGHWKADNMIGQGFLWQSDAELKRCLELSPGPKSPSASHIQKRSRDATMISEQKTMGSSATPNVIQHLPGRKFTLTFLNRTVTIEEESVPTNLHADSPVSVVPSGASISHRYHTSYLAEARSTVNNLIADLTSQFPLLINAPSLLQSMNKQPLLKQGKTSKEVATLLKRIQSADPASPDIDEDNLGQSWGHYQFTAGGVSPSSLLNTWQDIGSVDIAFKLVAASLKTCQDARAMCANAGTPKMSGFISDIYLEQILDRLEKCWVGAGRQMTSSCIPIVPITPPRRTITIKPPRPNDNVTATAPEPPRELAKSTIHQQPAAGTEPMQEPSVALDEGARADAIFLRLLQIPELLAWINDNKISIPKLKRKDDIIAAIIQTPEFAQVSKSTIEQIVEQRKLKKGPKQPGAPSTSLPPQDIGL